MWVAHIVFHTIENGTGRKSTWLFMRNSLQSKEKNIHSQGNNNIAYHALPNLLNDNLWESYLIGNDPKVRAGG